MDGIVYKALYRQWRPKDFEGLIGQEHVGVTLKNAIVTGRISHAYLFTGPRGYRQDQYCQGIGQGA